MTREALPTRRENVIFPLKWKNGRYEVMASFFPDGRPAEAFVSCAKIGSDIQALSRDGAIMLSLALQFGCPLETIRHALTRGENGEPASVIGALVDEVEAERNRRGERT